MSDPQSLSPQRLALEEVEAAGKPGPRPHRCNDRIEDLLQALFTVELQKVRPALGHLWSCLSSKPGQEPVDPYVVIKDGKQYLERQERKKKVPF